MKTLTIIIFCMSFIFFAKGQTALEKAAMKKAIQDSIAMARTMSSHGQTQLEMNQDAGSSSQKADQELNTIYQKILKDYAADTSFISHLKVAERLWIKFRDAEVLMKFPPGNEYGSVMPMCMAGFEEQLTRERIKTLKQWVNGVEEGDACNGSIKIKHLIR